jgi:hypothetical protein
MKLIVLTTEPITAAQWRDALPGPTEPREDVDDDEICQRFGLPVDRAEVSAG